MGRDSAKAAKKTANSSAGSAASAEYAAKQQAIRQRHLAIMEEDSEAKKIVSSNKPTTICHC
jgi:hypothetical protein